MFFLIKKENSEKKVNMNVVPLLAKFLANFRIHSGPQIGPRSIPKNLSFQVNFSNLFSGLKPLQVPLESRLEPLMLVLRAPKTRKVWFSNWKITLFANAAFRYFEALEVLLGSILAHHGPL